jgi:micrococcal nuclease
MLLAVLVGAALAGERAALQGTVVRVLDGDTIHVEVNGRTEKVRYIGVNTPETNHPVRGEEPGGREATEANRQLVAGKQVRLELDVQERDRYGRVLAYVYVGDQMVNAELVRRGYAQVMTIPPNVRHQELFVKLQREAREQKRGLWADQTETAAPPAAQADRPSPGGRPGVPPESAWMCPASQPIKGNFTTYSGERCIYHVPGGQFYGKTKPERCYATEDEARRDGCRRSKR